MTEKNKKFNPDREEETQYHPYLLQVSQKAVIYNPADKTFLLVKDVDEKSFFSSNFGPWELVGGRLQKGESIKDCLQREIREEIGNIQYEIVAGLGVADIEYRTGKAIAVGHLLFYRGGEIKLSQEHSQFRWASLEEIEKSSEYKPWVKNLVKGAVPFLKCEEYLEGWRRCQADFENYKKRQIQSQREFSNYACQSVVLEILPVLDNFYASTTHIPQDQDKSSWVIGIMHIQKQLEGVLRNNGVEEIEVKLGDEFNPNIHEAMKSGQDEKNLRQDGSGRIKEVLTRGYKMGEKIIRAARVIVE